MTYNSSIIGAMLDQIDTYGMDFVVNTYQGLVNQFSPMIFTLSGIYLGTVFLSIKRGVLAFNDLPFIILRMVCILTLALNYGYFSEFVYQIFTNVPLIICKAITLKRSMIMSCNIYDALDEFLRDGLAISNRLFLMGGWHNATYTIFGGGVFVATLIAAGIATGLIILAKIACMVILSLSPIFIFFAMFESTKGVFDSYICQLISYALIPIMTCAVLMIVLSVSVTMIGDIDQREKASVTALVPFLIACVVQIWLLLQVQQKCANLASGFNLKSVMSTVSVAANGFKNAANIATGGKLGRAAMVGSLKLLGKGGSAVSSFIGNRMKRYRKS